MERKKFKIEKEIHRVVQYFVVAIRYIGSYKRLIDMHPKTRETCFNCNHKFNDTDAVYLGLLDGHKNEIFCEKCAKKISENI